MTELRIYVGIELISNNLSLEFYRDQRKKTEKIIESLKKNRNESLELIFFFQIRVISGNRSAVVLISVEVVLVTQKNLIAEFQWEAHKHPKEFRGKRRLPSIYRNGKEFSRAD